VWYAAAKGVLTKPTARPRTGVHAGRRTLAAPPDSAGQRSAALRHSTTGQSGLTVWVMTKEEIARILEQTAALLELKGENPFKIRAYVNAARAIETFGGNIPDLQDEEA